MSAIRGLHYKFRNLFLIEQEVGAKLNAILPLPTTQKMGIEFDTHLLLVL